MRLFTIEFVIVRDGDRLGVVERMTAGADRLADAEHTARSLVERVRRNRPETPPDGFQILDKDGRIVLRSWEMQR